MNDRMSELSCSVTPKSKNAPITNFSQMNQRINKKVNNSFGDAFKNFNQLKNNVTAIQELLESDEAQSDNSNNSCNKKQKKINIEIKELEEDYSEHSQERDDPLSIIDEK